MTKTIKIDDVDYEWLKANKDGRTIKAMVTRLIALVKKHVPADAQEQ